MRAIVYRAVFEEISELNHVIITVCTLNGYYFCKFTAEFTTCLNKQPKILVEYNSKICISRGIKPNVRIRQSV